VTVTKWSASCTRMCVRERDREREREKGEGKKEWVSAFFIILQGLISRWQIWPNGQTRRPKIFGRFNDRFMWTLVAAKNAQLFAHPLSLSLSLSLCPRAHTWYDSPDSRSHTPTLSISLSHTHTYTHTHKRKHTSSFLLANKHSSLLFSFQCLAKKNLN